MLQAHSLLWHYLWLAPHILQVALAILMWRKGLHRLFPVFLAYTVFEAIEEFTLYGLDVLPWVKSETFWQAFWVGLIIEGLLKFALTGELFRHLLHSWPAVAKTGNQLITSAGIVLVLVAGLTAGLIQPASPYWLISGAHALQQSMYVVESGLVLLIILFAAYFRLTWGRQSFGIVLGLAILSCEHLAAWAITASGVLGHRSYLLDFVNMATYHACVLIWFYYLLVPAKTPEAQTNPMLFPPQDSLSGAPQVEGLAVWNEEMERLLHR